MANVGISTKPSLISVLERPCLTRWTSVYRVCGVLGLNQVHNISHFGVRLYHDQLTLRFEAKVGNGRPGQNKWHVNRKRQKMRGPWKIEGKIHSPPPPHHHHHCVAVTGLHIIGKISIPALGGAMFYHQTSSMINSESSVHNIILCFSQTLNFSCLWLA